MAKSALSTLRILIFGLLGLFSTASHQARAVIAETAAAGVILNKLHDQFQDLIDHARDSGDFLTWRVAITGRDLIDAWQKSNTEIINTAFDKLDKTKQDFLRGVDANVDKLINQKNITIDQADAISSEWSQIIATTYLASDRPFVMQYSPRVIVPEGESIIHLRVRGPNLGKSDPRITTDPFKDQGGSSPAAQEVVFDIKRSDLDFPEQVSSLSRITVQYTVPKLFVLSERAHNDLLLWLLPRRLGHYRVSTIVEVEQREATTRTVNLGQFRGRNSRIPRAVLVPDTSLGWRLDLARRNEIRLVQGGADRGRCEGIEDQSVTENGLTMFAHVDDRDQPFNRRDAWTDCSISLPLYRITRARTEGRGAEGDLSWTRDVSVNLPAGLVSMEIRVDFFDRRSRVFTGSGADRYLDVRAEGGLLIFRPMPPRDF